MGEKRQHDYGEHPDRAAKRQREAGNTSADKPRYQQPGFKKHARRPESSNWAKKRARTIERRLRNPDSLPANVQRDLETELAALQQQIEERQGKRLRAHMISKYHMLRFFERKKATRRQKQLQKRHDTTDDAAEKAELAKDLTVAEIDVLYPQYYPFLEPYVSLYPQSKKGDEEGDEKEEKEGKDDKTAQFSREPRPPMWQEIKDAYEAGGLRALQKIRDRQPEKEGKPAKKGKETKEAKSSKDSQDSKPSTKTKADDKAGKSKYATKVEEGSDSEDGGFFEM